MSTKKREILHWSWCNIDFKQYLSPFTSDFIYAITLNRKTITLGSIEKKRDLPQKELNLAFFIFYRATSFPFIVKKIKKIF